MKKYFYKGFVGALLLACGSTNLAFAQASSMDSQLWSVEDLDSYLSSKGFVETRKRDGVLRLAGDVRARWIYAKEDLETTQTPAKPMLPTNRYRSEFNLYVDYTAANSWMTSKMNWVTIAGGESSAAGLDINRAFLGYRFYKNPETQAEVFAEIGRSGLGDIFDSTFSLIVISTEFIYTLRTY
uniref:Lorf2; possible membrane-bound protein n=1 Tax=Chlamydia trachomatis TaxID=813 RepID=Q46379_CHLTH|nr:lorf2; possible membrane-bound protein [Chlamydia trachomatis]